MNKDNNINQTEINPSDFFIKTDIIKDKRTDWIEFQPNKEFQLMVLELENDLYYLN